ncbi:hypothetical protein FHX37_0039 [Haloactinospora alba]|uniref:Uncharacterized protein n=1 Tax=Haloactinospora alba TaxID=405555 RepID=A0A543NEA5_9ACTN|nr:hypothetical protein [Haloactinospora alba]TQN30178.1 hypothetical protein FHX37_0039 [Haloactinospora alba]
MRAWLRHETSQGRTRQSRDSTGFSTLTGLGARAEERTVRESVVSIRPVLARDAALRVAADMVRSGEAALADEALGAAHGERLHLGSDTKYLGIDPPPVEELVHEGDREGAEAAAELLHELGYFMDLDRAAQRLEAEGDWDNAALLYRLSAHTTSEDEERLAAARAAAEAAGENGGRLPPTPPPAGGLRTHVLRSERAGEFGEAERLARLAADAGHGEVLEEYARRRVDEGSSTEHWNRILNHGLDTDGREADPWCPQRGPRGDLRPSPRLDSAGRRFVSAPEASLPGRITGARPPLSPAGAPLAWSFIGGMLLYTLADPAASVYVDAMGTAGIVLSILLLPVLTAQARGKWRLRWSGATLLLLYGWFWSPAMIAVQVSPASEGGSWTRRVIAVLTLPFSGVALSLVQCLHGPLGTPAAVAVGCATVLVALAAARVRERDNHRDYLLSLREDTM